MIFRHSLRTELAVAISYIPPRPAHAAEIRAIDMGTAPAREGVAA